MISDKEAAFILFREEVPQNEIAKILGKTEKTISRWKKDEGWEEKLVKSTIEKQTTEEDIREILNYQLHVLKVMKDSRIEDHARGQDLKLLSKGDIDSVRDLFNCLKAKEVEWNVYVKVTRELLKYLRGVNLSLSQDLADLADDFLNLKRKSLQ